TMTTGPQRQIRNFAIIAHIDHGKSTLADRLIQMTGGLSAREMKEQVLDTMDIERERGITIKAQTVRLNYRARDGKDYILNLIDTWYDAYLGVVVVSRIVGGVLRKGMKVRMMGTAASHEVDKVGVFTPKLVDLPELRPGELGFLTGSIKEVADTRVGDTITDD